MQVLTKSVGSGGINVPSDVKKVQQHLNAHSRDVGLSRPLMLDGVVGPKTVAAINAFQQKVLQVGSPDARVDPNGPTWKALSGNRPSPTATLPKIGKPIHPIDVSSVTINAAGEALIKNAESKGGVPIVKAYICPAGKLTIGWGHTGTDVKAGMTIDKGQAETLFRKDVSKFENVVRQDVKVPLSSNQFSALVSFTFNVGAAAFKGSTLLKKLNAGDYQSAAQEFGRWVHGGGKVLPGLVIRRRDEQQLFQTS